MKISEKINYLRKSKGMSQEELAEKLYVSRQAISRWEQGTAMPDAENILQISKLFDVTADYLLNDDYENDGDVPIVKKLSDECKETKVKKKKNHLIAAVCFLFAVICSILGVVNSQTGIQLALSCFTLALSAGSAVTQFCLYFKK